MKRLVGTVLLALTTIALGSGFDDDDVIYDFMSSPIIKLKGKEAQSVDSAIYRPASKEYRVTKGPATITYKLEDVEYCILPRPTAIKEAKDIEKLESILKEYDHRWWDKEAAKILVWLYVKNGEPAKAVALYKSMKPQLQDDKAFLTRHGYWIALLRTKQYSALDADLTDAAANGSRYMSAWAYITRGDMLAAQDKPNEALAEGYLKSVAMFGDIRPATVLALRKTIALMEKQGDRRVERFQKMLKVADLKITFPEELM